MAYSRDRRGGSTLTDTPLLPQSAPPCPRRTHTLQDPCAFLSHVRLSLKALGGSDSLKSPVTGRVMKVTPAKDAVFPG